MVNVPSREQLLHLLAEAAELEHNLLCSYLFAMFTLKESTEEDLQPEELQAVRNWRKVLLSVCIEEMTHLAQVANLTVALGSRPHFNRPNLPVASGYHPASVVIDLARLDMATLNHLIFLERPEGVQEIDGQSYRQHPNDVRRDWSSSLMPAAPKYETIGQFYEILRDSLVHYAEVHGEAALFIGSVDVQLTSSEVGGTLRVVHDLDSGCAAIDDIVRQGEGAPGDAEGSHYSQFKSIRIEYENLLAKRPAFDPARAVGRNPVMRPPMAEQRTHVTAKSAACVLDMANSLYSFMLRCLAECYETSRHQAPRRTAIVKATFGSMRAFSVIASTLTLLPAQDHGDEKAGVSFAMLRSTEGPSDPSLAYLLLNERLCEIRSRAPGLPLPTDVIDGLLTNLEKLAADVHAFA